MRLHTCQIQCVALQGGVLNDVQFRKVRLTWGVKTGAAPEATVDPEDTSTEHMSTEEQSKKIVPHEEEEGGI